MEEHPTLLNWVLGGVVALLTGAATVIASLWKLNETRNKEEIEFLKEQHKQCEENYKALRKDCDDQHKEANIRILASEIRIAKLEAMVVPEKK